MEILSRRKILGVAEEFGRGGTEKGAAFTDDRSPSSQSAEECADEGIEKDVTFTDDRNPSSQSAGECADEGTVKGAAFTDDRKPSSQSVGECADGGIEKGIIADCAELIDDDTLGQIGVNLEVNNQENDVNFEKGTTTEARQETDLDPLVSECTALRDEIRNNSDESKHEDESKEHGECFNGEAVACEKSTIVEKTREINVTDGEADGEDFEEGEIPNDLDNLSQPLDSEQEPAGQEDEKLEEASVCQHFDKNQNPIYTMPVSSNVNLVDGGSRTKENYMRNGSSSTLVSAGSNQEFETFVDDGCLKLESCSSAAKADVNLANKKKEKPSETELVAEVRVKKKPHPLSKERKAKKKIANKRKKAQKEGEQGVKRLKLQPIMKPKEVKYCNFYLIGRCQKGDSCKFAHDTIPMSKNQPCNFFARNSCLKGDDCPFDHELSKYPCHNYMTEGMCHRGDVCKFSHAADHRTSISCISSEQSRSSSVVGEFKFSKTTPHAQNHDRCHWSTKRHRRFELAIDYAETLGRELGEHSEATYADTCREFGEVSEATYADT